MVDARVLLRVGAAVFAAAVTSACDGGSPTPPAPIGPEPVPGATQVTGRERVAWEQPGDGTSYSFRAYVDDVVVELTAASCTVTGVESQCSAPLPAMSDGVHALQLVAVSPYGDESERSDPITLQKITARAAQTASALPDAVAAWPANAHASGPAAAAEVLARDVRLPAQLAALPDGRLLVAEAGGRVRVVDLEARQPAGVALEAGALLDPAPGGALAIAAHPDFMTTRHAFLSDLYRDDRDSLRLRVVRVREAGGRLGEPATIFVADVAPHQAPDGGAAPHTTPEAGGPRLVFGADGLLYVSLPPGLVFDREPAASEPVAAVVRLAADGSRPTKGALQGVTAHPLAFASHPASGELMAVVSDGPADATLRGLAVPAASFVPGAASPLRVRLDRDGTVPLLRIDTLTAGAALAAITGSPAGATASATAGASADTTPSATVGVVATAAALWPHTVRLAVPAELDGLVPGLNGHLTDLVTQGGAIYGVVADAAGGADAAEPHGVIVRFRP